MGYFDYEAKFNVALFDRSSFDYLFGIAGTVVTPLSVAVSIPEYNTTITKTEYDVAMSIPEYNITMTKPEYVVAISIQKYNANIIMNA